jgi:hypothetical protein
MELVDKQQTKTSLGMLSKAWYTDGEERFLVKGNSNNTIGKNNGFEPFSEVLAYRLGKLLGLNVVEYQLRDAGDFPEVAVYDCKYVSVCADCRKDGKEQLLSFAVWADVTNGKTVTDYFNYYLRSELNNDDLARMLVFDAVTGNSDRHLNNFDVVFDGKSVKLGPIFDNGAAFLALIPDSELKEWKGIGPDKSKPFKETHSKQIQLVERFVNKSLFSVNTLEVYREWCNECEDVFSVMSKQRAKCIQNYVKNRISFVNRFNVSSIF